MWCCICLRKGKKCSLRSYVEKITVNPRPEEYKIVVIGEAISRESVPQSISYWKEVTFLLTEYEGNEDVSSPFTWYSGSQLQKSGLVELNNVTRLNICRGNSERVASGLRRFVCR